MQSRKTSASWLKGISDLLASQGCDPEPLFNQSGIDYSNLSDVDFRCGTELVTELWRLAVEATSNPAISLAAPNVARPGNFEVLGYAMMSCPTLRASLERMVAYIHIVASAAHAELVAEDSNLRLDLEVFGGKTKVPRQRVEFDLVTYLNFCRWASGKLLKPQRVEFAFPEPVDIAPFTAAFEAECRFGATRNSLVFSSTDLDVPLLASNPAVAELHDKFVVQRLKRLQSSNLSFRVRDVIVQMLPDGEPKRHEIARALSISERTLQRRLDEEGLTYVELLDETRKELAQGYLEQGTETFAEIAYLLGFADQSNFFRACKRWFGVSPGQFRAQAESARQSPP